MCQRVRCLERSCWTVGLLGRVGLVLSFIWLFWSRLTSLISSCQVAGPKFSNGKLSTHTPSCIYTRSAHVPFSSNYEVRNIQGSHKEKQKVAQLSVETTQSKEIQRPNTKLHLYSIILLLLTVCSRKDKLELYRQNIIPALKALSKQLFSRA